MSPFATDLMENSKRDDAVIVGSDVRALCMEIRNLDESVDRATKALVLMERMHAERCQQRDRALAEVVLLKARVAELEAVPPTKNPYTKDDLLKIRTEADALSTDAERWRGLLRSARIKPYGSAGLSNDDNYAHLGLELWTVFPETTDNRLGVEWLTRYADKARKIKP